MSRLRSYRQAAGLSQAELANRAGVSRQLVGAAEAGRNLPRVDAGVAIATALGVTVESLFAAPGLPVDVLSGEPVADGEAIRSGWVGNTLVSAPFLNLGSAALDGVVEHGGFVSFSAQRPGLVVAGCEPGLEVLEMALRRRGAAALAVMASSAAAIEALRAGRVHAAVVHGPALSHAGELPELERIRLASWAVGLADAPDAAPGWFEAALSGTHPVVQRERGAGVQQAFEAALRTEVTTVPGPHAASHRESAIRALFAGMPAVTIEPAARSVGAVFEPLDVHDTEIWIDRKWIDDRIVTEALDVLGSREFRAHMQHVGGYELANFGMRRS